MAASGVPVVIASWADPAALGALATGGRIGTRIDPNTSIDPATRTNAVQEYAPHG